MIISDDVLDVKIGESWKIGYKSATQEYLGIWDYTLHILIKPYDEYEVKLISYGSSKAQARQNHL